MLAELAAANAAFTVIKQAVSNGKEIAAAGNAIAEFVGAKKSCKPKLLRRAMAPILKSLWLSNRFAKRRRTQTNDDYLGPSRSLA